MKKKSSRSRKKTFAVDEELKKALDELEPTDFGYLHVGMSAEDPSALPEIVTENVGKALWKFARIGIAVERQVRN